ncbi:MAG: branched-chain amino acid ABC transporter substrate-binding protein [Propionibacteriaceae bacterium]|jgi:branched-chain amino acid transport system substrate-binding protein|nr:branched-chain amino acid ABC transporter substrate-binding protein [Propionibacteriaceae bacterium]
MTNSWTKKALALCAAMAAATLSLTACGGSSDTLKIGMAIPTSGENAMYGEYMIKGAQLAVDEINAAGGLLGKQLEIKTSDSACEAGQATSAANDLVTEEIVVSMGGYCSGATLPTIDIFSKANIPMIIPAANSNSLVETPRDNVFLVNGVGSDQAKMGYDWTQKNGYKSLLVIDDKTDYSVGVSTYYQQFAKEAGATIDSISLNPKEKDFSGQVAEILKHDSFYFTGYAEAAGLLIKQSLEAGYSGGILVADGSVDVLTGSTVGQPKASEVIYGTFSVTPDMIDDGGAFISTYKAKFGNEEPGPYVIQTYDSVKLWAQAVTEAGSVEMDAVDAVLHKIEYDGLTGPISFNADGSRKKSPFVIVKVSEDNTFKLFDDMAS